MTVNRPDRPVPAISLGLATLVLVPFGLGYFMSYLFRAVNAVVAPDLVAELGLSAAELGRLTAIYLLAFALFQLPLGVLLDRFGPRRVQFVLLLVTAAGALLFGYGRDAFELSAARALIGLGVAGGLMASFKAVVLWIPEPRRPLANSLVMSIGAVGLLVSTAPTEWAVAHYGWRSLFIGLAALTAAIACLILLVVPERSTAATGERLATQLAALRRIYADRAFWSLAPLLATTAGTHVGIQTLWAGPWFRDVGGLDRTGVAEHLFYAALAFFVGILVSGAVSDWFVRRGFSVLTVMLGFLVPYAIGQSLIILAWPPLMLPAWLLFGMSGQVAILAYPWLSSYFGAQLSGRANTAMNLLIFAMAFASQYAIGWIIDFFPVTSAGGYPLTAYRVAFGAFLGLQALAFFWYLHNWPLLHGRDRVGRAS